MPSGKSRPHCRRSICRLTLPILFLSSLMLSSRGGAQTTVENWERWEQTLTTTRNYPLSNGNPYRDLILKVTYTPVSGFDSPSCQPFKGYGFWDGGNTFKIRSAFPEVGAPLGEEHLLVPPAVFQEPVSEF